MFFPIIMSVFLKKQTNEIKAEIRFVCKHLRGNLLCSMLNKKAFEKKQLVGMLGDQFPPSFPSTCSVFLGSPLKNGQLVCSRTEKDKHLESQRSLTISLSVLKTHQDNLRRAVCNSSRPISVTGGSTRVR